VSPLAFHVVTNSAFPVKVEFSTSAGGPAGARPSARTTERIELPEIRPAWLSP
jgi:hypothetical protein